jgi:hypothetical protein
MMPLSKYFQGSGEKVMRNMKKEYGEKKGKEVFYATANKRKKNSVDTGPSEKMRKNHKV